MPEYRIIEVRTKRELNRFVRFPDELYRGCSQYVPALHSDQIRTLTESAPLYYCSHKMWLALDGNKVAGRICGMINPRYNELYNTRRARFGWFDCIDDNSVAALLLGTAEHWASEQGMTEIHGPLSFNTLGKQGLLVDGFGNTPPFNCLYNYPYYQNLVEEAGYEKECDWVQYKVAADNGVPEKTLRMAEIVRKKYGISPVDINVLKKDKERVRGFFRKYSESFAASVKNFIPFTDKEIDEEAAQVLPFISGKSSCILQDRDGNIVAFGIATPSLSEALKKADGHLFPFGWIHILRAKNNYETMDLLINGAVPDWQNRGVSAVYYKDMADKAAANGSKWAVTNPQIESNGAVNLWNAYEREAFMRRRCYLKSLAKRTPENVNKSM